MDLSEIHYGQVIALTDHANNCMCCSCVRVVLSVDGYTNCLEGPEYQHANCGGHEEASPSNALTEEPSNDCDNEIENVKEAILQVEYYYRRAEGGQSGLR